MPLHCGEVELQLPTAFASCREKTFPGHFRTHRQRIHHGCHFPHRNPMESKIDFACTSNFALHRAVPPFPFAHCQPRRGITQRITRSDIKSEATAIGAHRDAVDPALTRRLRSQRKLQVRLPLAQRSDQPPRWCWGRAASAPFPLSSSERVRSPALPCESSNDAGSHH